MSRCSTNARAGGTDLTGVAHYPRRTGNLTALQLAGWSARGDKTHVVYRADRTGATGTRLVDIHAESLDERHALARTKWEVVFDHEHAPGELDTSFLLRNEDHWRIALYLNHGSLPELLGLLAVKSSGDLIAHNEDSQGTQAPMTRRPIFAIVVPHHPKPEHLETFGPSASRSAMNSAT